MAEGAVADGGDVSGDGHRGEGVTAVESGNTIIKARFFVIIFKIYVPIVVNGSRCSECNTLAVVFFDVCTKFFQGDFICIAIIEIRVLGRGVYIQFQSFCLADCARTRRTITRDTCFITNSKAVL